MFRKAYGKKYYRVFRKDYGKKYYSVFRKDYGKKYYRVFRKDYGKKYYRVFRKHNNQAVEQLILFYLCVKFTNNVVMWQTNSRFSKW